MNSSVPQPFSSVLPPGDNARSPFTGYTREHWLALADAQLAAVQPYASDGGALIALPGRPSRSGPMSDALEGFARTFLLAAFRVTGGQGGPPWVLENYRRGLITGTDPASAEAWPPIEDRGQPLVEAASIALGLHLTRPWLWASLSDAERDQVARWLGGARGVATPDNNWVLFRVIIQEFLASVGMPYAAADIEYGLARIEDWYVGDGWYRDGNGDNFDYYCGWAMHLYPVLWTQIAQRRDPALAAERLAVYRERLRRFLQDYVLFFGADGAPVFQGRSLIYRFGAAAPLWIGELLGVAPVAPGAVRRIASGVLRHFVDGGAFDDRGLLTSGWFGDFPPMVQPYSGPGSPYWASKGFLGLLLPPDSPVWTETELPSPVEFEDVVRTLRAPGFLLSATRADGIVRLSNHGSDHQPPMIPGDDPHYSRLAYSSRTTPTFGPDPADSHIAVLDNEGRPSRRTRIHRIPMLGDGTLASRHHPVWANTDDDSASPWTITSVVAVQGPYELRLHRIQSATSTTALVRESAYAIPVNGRPHSQILSVLGEGVQGVTTSPVASPLGDRVVPWIDRSYDGTDSTVASLVVLTDDQGVLDTLDELRATTLAGGKGVEVTLPNGVLRVLLPPEPCTASTS